MTEEKFRTFKKVRAFSFSCGKAAGVTAAVSVILFGIGAIGSMIADGIKNKN